MDLLASDVGDHVGLSDSADTYPGSSTSSDQAHLFATLSLDALAGSDGPKTMRFMGSLQEQEILILVDTDSTHSFLSISVAARLQGVQPLSRPIRVQVANGAVLQCSHHLPNAIWSIDDHSFSADLRVLPLQHFDLILGMDWLESFSPMKIHWKSKWMAIPYDASSVTLQGLLPHVPTDTVVQLCSIAVATSDDHPLQPEVSSLLSEFASVFAPVSGLPPSRACDRSIPLVAGPNRFSFGHIITLRP